MGGRDLALAQLGVVAWPMAVKGLITRVGLRFQAQVANGDTTPGAPPFVPLADMYDTDAQARVAVEAAFGGSLLQWTQADLIGIESYRGESV